MHLYHISFDKVCLGHTKIFMASLVVLRRSQFDSSQTEVLPTSLHTAIMAKLDGVNLISTSAFVHKKISNIYF